MARRTSAPTMATTRSSSSSPSKSSVSLYVSALCAITVSIFAAMLAISYFWCPSKSPMEILEPLLSDSHYKYLVPLLVPTAAWFVIANWVGWEYFRYA